MGFFIGEADPVDFDLTLTAGWMSRIRFVRLLGRLIDNVEHPLGAGDCRLQLGDDAGNLVERLGVLVGVGQKAGQCTHRKAACNAGESADDGNRRIDHPVDKAGAGIGQRRIKLRLDPYVVQLMVDPVKLLLGALLIGKGFDHLLVAHQLLDAAAQLTLDGALAAEHIKGMFCNKGCHKQRQRRDDHHYQTHLEIDCQHIHQRDGNGDDSGEQLGKALKQPVRNRVDVVDDAADDVAVRAAVDVGERKFLHMFKCSRTQVTHRLIGDDVGTQGQQPLEERCQNCHDAKLDQNWQQVVKIHLAGCNNLIDSPTNQHRRIQGQRNAEHCADQSCQQIPAVWLCKPEDPCKGFFSVFHYASSFAKTRSFCDQ